MPQPELDRLLINNLGDLEAAARHLKADLMPAVASALNECSLEFCRRQDWFGVAEYDNAPIWMAPHEWHVNGGGANAFHCWFALDASDAEWANVHFWLACMAGVGPKRMGMRWSQNIANKRIWRRHMAEQAGIISRLRSRGFEYHESLGSFFLPIRLDPEALASAMGDEAPEAALAPFSDGLRRCLDAVNDFDELRAGLGE